jgi:endoglycosylceramidase
MRRALIALAVLLALPVPAAGAATGRLHPAGRWLKDDRGRVVIIHGLQVAHKTAPYYPPPQSFTDGDGQNLEDWGFNGVRLAWFWAGLEPQRGQFSTSYADEIAREGEVLSSHHVYTLLEAHQDLYGPALDGDGFPSWATITDGVPQLPHSALDIEAPATNRAFDNLYANSDGIADEFARAWTTMAARFRSNPLMLGYDVFNEPYPGSQDATCMQPAGCPAFDQLSLGPLEDRLATAVHTSDPGAIAFLEPHIYFDFGVQSWLTAAARGPTGFAFHDYCLAPIFSGSPDHESSAPGYQGCPTEDEHVMENAEAAAAALHAPPLFDEFGDTQDLADIERMVELADSHRMGWMYWGYKDWVDAPGGAGSGALFDNSDDNATLRKAKLAILSEPYPQATAGTPGAYDYDRGTDTFTYSYTPAASVRAPTVVYVPPIHYPGGYRVAVSGARVVSQPGATLLELANRRGAGEVRLVVGPATSP